VVPATPGKQRREDWGGGSVKNNAKVTVTSRSKGAGRCVMIYLEAMPSVWYYLSY